jgi:uncharacterized protein (UPF0332 family)
MSTEPREKEIASCWSRAQESLLAAEELQKDGFHDFAASRAYYAAFYAASAVLLGMGLEFSKHSATLGAINLHFVKTGRIDKETGKNLRWLFELRGVGDYGLTVHVSADDAAKSIECARVIVASLASAGSQGGLGLNVAGTDPQ